MSQSHRDLEVLFDSEALCGAKQQALARLLEALLTTEMNGRPFIMSPGELRAAIRIAEKAADLPQGDGVLNHRHALLPDPVVSCASEDQLLMHLEHRFPREKHVVVFDGFDTPEQARHFAGWYSGCGEQQSDIWMEEHAGLSFVSTAGIKPGPRQEVVVTLRLTYPGSDEPSGE
jgi:hypothetical protein